MIENFNELMAFLVMIAFVVAMVGVLIRVMSAHHAKRIEAMEDEYYDLTNGQDDSDDSYM